MEPQVHVDENVLLNHSNFHLRTVDGLVVMPPEGLYECTLCGQAFNEETDFEHHRKSQHEDHQGQLHEEEVVTDETKVFMYACERCSSTFLDVTSYEKHLQQCHHLSDVMSVAVSTSSDKLTCCTYCNYSTTNNQDLLIHEQRHNHDLLKYPCEQCGDFFETEDLWRSHNCRKLFTCDECPATYRYKQGLRLHAKTHQPGYIEPEKKHPCKICNKRFVRRQVMLVHMKTHGDSTTPPNEHKCPVCEKIVSSKTYLIVHMRKHTGEKPFRCDVCSTAFISQNYLSVHKRTHSGEKPHSCVHCNKTFSQRTTLVVHERRHTGIKPYACDQCPKAFASKTMLNSHMKTHNKQCVQIIKDPNHQLEFQQQEQSILLTQSQEELVTTTTMFVPQVVIVGQEPIVQAIVKTENDSPSPIDVDVKML